MSIKCPHCPTGWIESMPATMEETYVPRYPRRDAKLPTRKVDVLAAFCSGCEYTHLLQKVRTHES